MLRLCSTKHTVYIILAVVSNGDSKAEEQHSIASYSTAKWIAFTSWSILFVVQQLPCQAATKEGIWKLGLSCTEIMSCTWIFAFQTINPRVCAQCANWTAPLTLHVMPDKFILYCLLHFCPNNLIFMFACFTMADAQLVPTNFSTKGLRSKRWNFTCIFQVESPSIRSFCFLVSFFSILRSQFR